MITGRMQPERIKFNPMTIREYPLRGNVIGRARNFIDDFIEAMSSEKIYREMGVDSDKSFLITGAPGNGKSLAVEVLVNEANIEAMKRAMLGEVPKFNLFGFRYDTGRYGTAYINEGSKIVQGFFDTCFAVAENGHKTMVVFDEAENLFGSRTGLQTHKEDSKVLETIMKNMQVLHDTRNMYAVMMSNFPEAFDEASVRAGRVDKRYEFSKPNQSEREFGFQHAIDQVNERAGYQVVRGYDIGELSAMSGGFSYADVVESVNSAVKLRAKEISGNRKDKRIVKGWIAQGRLRDSVGAHGKMFGVDRRRGGEIGFV